MSTSSIPEVGHVHKNGNALVDLTEYYSMPPLYLLDDFDRCMEEYPIKATYCYTWTTIRPNETSALWTNIKKFSNDSKHHFRHDRLSRGICMNWCKKRFDRFDRPTKNSYFAGKFENETEIQFDPNTITEALHYRGTYNKLINMCVNYELKRQYNLMAYSSVNYCLSNTDIQTIDIADISFLLICVVLTALIVASSIYDYQLKETSLKGLNFYKTPIDNKVKSALVCFSLLRNWYRLNSKSKNETSIDLRPIHAIRFLTMFFVIIGHTTLILNILPVLNPQYMERNFYRLITMLLINGTTVIQTFFVISGFLLSVQFMKLKEIKPFSIDYIWKFILHRFIRISPVYIFLIFFNATWLVKTQTGPLWPYAVDTERTFCRKNWWTNILYINNFISYSEPCLQHGWYLAADFQLFVIGVVLHVIMWKYPKYTKPLLGACVIISYVVPAALTYIYKFDGLFMVLPELQRYAHWHDKVYQIMYIPFYTNFGSFLCGTIGGRLYHKYKQKKGEMKKLKILVISFYLAIPLGVGLLISGYIFYANEFEKPNIWTALYSSILRNTFGICIISLILGMALGIGWLVRDLLCQPIFRTLGRLTYCAYLVHPILMRINFANARQPFYTSDLVVFAYSASIFLQAYFLSLLLCIFLELPISSLQRHFTAISAESSIGISIIELNISKTNSISSNKI